MLTSQLIHINYWRQGEKIQNFGDFLSEFFVENLFYQVSIESVNNIYVIGSTIDDFFVKNGSNYKTIFWGCGLRNEKSISKENLEKVQILAVRGPLTRSALKLGANIPIGDPVLLLPLLYQPKNSILTKNKKVLVPHFHDTRTDETLLSLSGCDIVIRPNITNNLEAIKEFIDQIVSAEFVLSGALHAAIVACAYNKKFAFWNNGYIDLPFKWYDFAKSINIDCKFSENIDEGEKVYEYIKNDIKIPKLFPLIASAPLPVKPDIAIKAFLVDNEIQLENKEVLEQLNSGLSVNQIINYNYLESAAHVENLKINLENLKNEINYKNDAIIKLEKDIESKNSEILRLKKDIENKNSEINNKNITIDDQKNYIESLKNEISEIHKSRAWKIVLFYYKIRDFCLPKNSLRRKIVKFLFKDLAKRLKSKINVNKKSHDAFKNNFFSEQVSYSDINSYEKEIFNNDILKQKVDHNKMLLIDCRLPTFDKDSGSLRMYSIMQILADLGFKITFVPDDFECNEPYLSYLTNLGIEVLCNNAAFEEHLKKYGPSFAYAFLSRPEIAFKYLPLVQAYAINSTIIYDTVDLHFIRFKREFEVLKDYTKKQQSDYYKQIEFHNMNNADITLVVTEEEKEYILKELPNINVKIVSNIHSVRDNVPSYRQRKDIMFIGGFWHYPNVDAVLYFKENIWPIIHQEDESIRFICVGSNPPEEIIKLNSKDIIVTGYVENIDYFFETCRVFVAPLRFGAGMKGKVGQSMSYGLPVVTTSIGAEGLKLNNFKNALITDNAKEFAKYTLELYNNEKLWNELSTNSINHIKLNFSFQSVKKNIKEILKLES